MDVLAGLAFMGSAINNKRKPKKRKQYRERIHRNYPKANNIYDSRQVKDNTRKVWDLAYHRYKKAEDPKKTGIVPAFHNKKKYWKKIQDERKRYVRDPPTHTVEMFDGNNSDNDSVFSDDTGSVGGNRSYMSIGNRSMGSQCSKKSLDPMQDHMALFEKANKLGDNRRHVNKYQRKDPTESQFLEQFEPLTFNNPTGPVSSNSASRKFGDEGYDRLNRERNMAFDSGYSMFDNKQDMTYGIVSDPKDFIHNNMVPSFKSATYGSDQLMQDKLNQNKQRKVEMFTGSLDDLNYRPKTERRPLFNPLVGLTNIYGTPNMTSFMETRYVPGRLRNNEKPFQPVRITPGLNLGYNELSKQGFHDTYRALPRTTDQLRTLNDPKISYRKPIIYGMKGTRRPILPNVAKRNPTTFWENDPRDFVKKSSYFKAPTIRGNYDVPITNRTQTTKEYFGPAGIENHQLRPTSMRPRHKISHKENFEDPGPMRAKLAEGGKGHAYDMESNVPDATNREIHGQTNYVGVAGVGEYGKGHAYDMNSNVPDPTLRDTTQNTGWVGVARGHDSLKHQAFDYSSAVPDPTMRDTTQNTGWVGVARGHEHQKHQAFDYSSAVPDPTMRDLTDKTAWVGVARGHEQHKRPAFDEKTNVPDPTLRDIHDKTTWLGVARGHEQHKRPAFDEKTNVPDPTCRDMTQNTAWLGVARGHEQHKRPAFDEATNVPDPTMRDIHDKTTWLGVARGHERHKHQAFDYSEAIPDPTMRNVHDKTTWLGVARGHERHKHQAFDYTNGIPDPTMRDIHDKTTWLGVAQGHEHFKPQAFDYSEAIPDPTMRDIHDKTTWVGVARGHERHKPQAFDYTNGIPDPTMRNLSEKTTWMGVARGHDQQKPQAFDYSEAIPDVTMRDIHINKDWLNPAGTNEHQKGGYQAQHGGTQAPATMRQIHQDTKQLNPAGTQEHEKGAYHVQQQGTQAPATMRQIHQDTKQLNPAGSQQYEKGGYIAKHGGTQAPPTLRQIHQDTKQLNPAGSREHEKQRSRGDASNSLVDVGTEEVLKGRAPTTSNYEKGPTGQFSMMRVCEPIQINRELYPDMQGTNVNDCLPTMYTRMGYALPHWTSLRYDTCIPPNVLKNNPYVNNTQHQSIQYSNQNQFLGPEYYNGTKLQRDSV